VSCLIENGVKICNYVSSVFILYQGFGNFFLEASVRKVRTRWKMFFFLQKITQY